ncbi:MAG TPA: hypothetical protein VH476_03100 [Solirubrobacterales bacterium]|jgi:hypothetical protein
MGGWRGRGTLGCALLAILALGAAGCGVEEHPNEQRPSPSTRVSVVVTDSGVSVQPTEVGVGPEPNNQLPQNRDAKQPRLRENRPLDVVMVAANLTDRDSELIVRGPGTEANLEDLFANSNGSFQTALRPGTYRISAAGFPHAKPARLTVGSYRASSENNVLLP